MPCSLQDIQKQARVVNEWKGKIEETEKLLAEYNAVAAREGFLLAQMMSNATGLDEELKQGRAKPKTPNSPAPQADTQKRRKQAEAEKESQPNTLAIPALRAPEPSGASGSNETAGNRASATTKPLAKQPAKTSVTEPAPPQCFAWSQSMSTSPDALVLSLSPVLPNVPQSPLVATSYRSGSVKFFQLERREKSSNFKELRELKGARYSSTVSMDWHRNGKVALLADFSSESEAPFTIVDPLALNNTSDTVRNSYSTVFFDRKERSYSKIKFLSSNKLVTAGTELSLWKLDEKVSRATSSPIHTSHSKRTLSLCLGSDHMLYSGAQDCKVCTYAFTSNQVVAEFPFANPVISICENPTAKDLLLVTLQQAKDQLHVIDRRASATPVAIFSISGEPLPHHNPAWSPDGYLIAAGADSLIHLFDLRNPKLVRNHVLDGQNGLFEFYPSGNKGPSDNLVVSLGNEGLLGMHSLL